MSREVATRVDARRFGTQGDGVNDDAPALRLAIAALRDFSGYKGASVGLPPGTYLIAAGSEVQVPDGITIEGTGPDGRTWEIQIDNSGVITTVKRI